MNPSRTAFSPAAVLRKAGPYALFLLLGVVMLYGPQLLLTLTATVHGAGLHPHAGEATTAEVLAQQQAAGWPSFGLVTGKLVTAAGAFLFFTILRWLVQRMTHPAPARWAKQGFGPAFMGLPDADKFRVFQALRLNSVILAAASLLFAALVQ